MVGGVFGGKCPILRLSGGEDRVGVWDVWVRPPRRAASQPGSRDRWGGAAAQWPQFERSPIQIGGGGDTGEENSGGGGSRLSSILKETGQQLELAKTNMLQTYKCANI